MAARVAFRGGWTCSCVAESLPWVEEDMRRRRIIREFIDIYQLGWRDDVSASKGVHAEGGNTDVGQRSPAAIQVWREWGWTMQDRSPWFPDDEHAHGWPWGCTHLADAAQYQVDDWENRKNGLANHGPVQGKWPVKKWDDALEEMVRKMYTLDDIADAVEARRKTFAREVWRGEYVPNIGFAKGSAEGAAVSGAEALTSIRAKQNETPGDTADQVWSGDHVHNIGWAAGSEGTMIDAERALRELRDRLDQILAALPKPPA